MSIFEAVSPVHRLTCDAVGCTASFVSDHQFYQRWEHTTRGEAARLKGWSVRPPFGKGSRSAPDLCPIHADDPNVELRRVDR